MTHVCTPATHMWRPERRAEDAEAYCGAVVLASSTITPETLAASPERTDVCQGCVAGIVRERLRR